jgi:hypothetical protein
MPTLLAILLLTAFPSNSLTSWMRLDSFRLAIGMPRAEVLETLEKWHPKQGKNADELVVDYTGEKALTLEFRKDRLNSVRFELFVFLPEVKKAFAEQREFLQKSFGDPRKSTKSILIYDAALPNVMVVANDDPSTEQGKKGIGVLAVRYYDPR